MRIRVGEGEGRKGWDEGEGCDEGEGWLLLDTHPQEADDEASRLEVVSK